MIGIEGPGRCDLAGGGQRLPIPAGLRMCSTGVKALMVSQLGVEALSPGLSIAVAFAPFNTGGASVVAITVSRWPYS